MSLKSFIKEQAKVEQIDAEGSQAGGYKIGDKAYVSDTAEALVDEAKEMASHTGKRWEDVLLQIIPKEQVTEAKYVSAAEFHDDFNTLLNSLKSAASDVGAKRGKLRNWLKRHDFANESQADEMFDLFLTKFHDAMTALRSCDKNLQKKL